MKPQPAASCGLIAWLENTRIALPLKGVEARFDVRGDLVSVELCQIYYQNHSQPLDVLYTFPLPGGAAVYRCEMIVNDRVISAKVMELEAARTLAQEKKAAGHRTALVESVRENLFELALGNLAPGDTVVIRLAWFQTLDATGHDRSFRIPFTPGVRYIPGTPLLRSNSGKGTASDTDEVPDASRLTPPRVDQFHPDAAWASVEGRIQLEGVDAAQITSPSHTMILRESDGSVMARLAGTGEVPDRDFVLRLPASSPAVLTPVAWITRDEDYSHALVRIIAPATAPATLTARDVYFLVDRSGSMEGAKWTATCKAFRAFLTNLAPQDRAWVTFFESDFRDLSEKPMPAGAILAEPVVQTLESWNVGGGTELLPALDHVLTALQKHSAKRSPVIILITDGQVGNEQTIIERMKPLPEVRVFCYGIDDAVNDAFLRRLAVQQRGACHLATPKDDFAGSIVSLAARLRHPVLTQICPPAGWELPGNAIPDLYAGEYLTVSLRGPSGSNGAGGLQFEARDGAGAPAVLTCPAHVVSDPAISRLWARERIATLLAANQHDGAMALSVSANIVCEHTAFIAWDDAERLAVTGPNREIYQPAFDEMELCASYNSAAVRAGRTAAAPCTQALPPCAPSPARPRAASGSGAGGMKKTTLFSKALKRLRRNEAPEQSSLDRTFPDLHVAASMASFDDDEFGSPPAPPVAESLIRTGEPLTWQGKLSALTNISLSNALLEWLEQWMWAEPAKVDARRRQLEELADTLAASADPTGSLVAWLTANLEPALREPALRELATVSEPA